ncbi:MAG: NUDIX domain-containing protein [Caldimonas sp.]
MNRIAPGFSGLSRPGGARVTAAVCRQRQDLAPGRPAEDPPTRRRGAGRDNRRVNRFLSPRSRRLSCGIVVLAPTRELLLCHVTGQRHWDLPKGGINEGETPRQAAVRETIEEAGLLFAAESLLDLGRFTYTAKKDLHLFATLSERVDPTRLCCESTFVERGSSRRLPEMDGFGWFGLDRVAELCTARMAAVLSECVDLGAVVDRFLAPPDRLAA